MKFFLLVGLAVAAALTQAHAEIPQHNFTIEQVEGSGKRLYHVDFQDDMVSVPLRLSGQGLADFVDFEIARDDRGSTVRRISTDEIWLRGGSNDMSADRLQANQELLERIAELSPQYQLGVEANGFLDGFDEFQVKKFATNEANIIVFTVKYQSTSMWDMFASIQSMNFIAEFSLENGRMLEIRPLIFSPSNSHAGGSQYTAESSAFETLIGYGQLDTIFDEILVPTLMALSELQAQADSGIQQH